MRLTSFTDFGLRALIALAGAPDHWFTVDGLAKAYKISRDHLTKVIRELARLGYVETQRGAGGGFRLARPAQSILLGKVVRDLERHHALVECFELDGGQCVVSAECLLRQPLAEAREAFYQSLDRTNLASCALSRETALKGSKVTEKGRVAALN